MKRILGLVTAFQILCADSLLLGASAQTEPVGRCRVLGSPEAIEANNLSPTEYSCASAAEQLSKDNSTAIKKLEAIANGAHELRNPDLQSALEQVENEIDQVRRRLDWLRACSGTETSQNTKEK
jgi:hypothetical protein